MPRKALRRLLPRATDIARDRNLRRVFGDLLHNPNLWHLNRHSVAWGVSVGLFMAFVPAPFQMILAAAAAIMIGCNLPVSVVVVWVSNPITMPPMFFAAYKVGAWILGIPPDNFAFEMSIDWLLSKAGTIWEPLLLGSFVLGLMTAALGQLAVRIIWRIHVAQSWRERKRRRQRHSVTLRGGRLVEEPLSEKPVIESSRSDEPLVAGRFVEKKEREPSQTT